MAQTKRAQILMAPEEYQRLEDIAQQREVSVAELIRAAVRECYFVRAEDPKKLVASICNMNMPLDDWEVLESEIEETHGNGLS